ncbi:MAG: hypothetical protein ACOYLO_10940 [Ferruginibacter sp.]
MKYVSKKVLLLAGVIIALLYLNSCSKSSPDPSPTDPCAGKTITITATGTASSGCASNGSISVSATGSTGFTFKLNSGGAYQASGSFTNVSPGAYTVYAKDAAGCEKTSTVSVTAGTKGPLFTLVRNLVTAKCQSCHNSSIQNGSMNWESDCNIVTNQARIKVRAVDEGTMPTGGPSLTVSEKAVITNWITAGGRLTD